MSEIKQNLSLKYDTFINEGHTKEEALREIYDAGKFNYAATYKPIYEHNALIQPFIFAALMDRKYKGADIQEQTHITVLNIIFISNQTYGNHKINPSQVCSYNTINALTKFPSTQLNRILKKLRVKGYVKRMRGTDEAISWKLRTNKRHWYYILTDKGFKEVKSFGTKAQALYKSFVSPDVLSNFNTYNFACNVLEKEKIHFNAHRSTYHYNKPSNQKLGLIVKDFKTRYPAKTDENNKDY
jgi:hypothetical protein